MYAQLLKGKNDMENMDWMKKNRYLLFALFFLFVSFLFPSPVAGEEIPLYCFCEFEYKKKLLTPTPESDKPVSSGPGYSLEEFCSSGKKDEPTETDVDCGGHCAISLGKKCGYYQNCKHDLDCLSGRCEKNFCTETPGCSSLLCDQNLDNCEDVKQCIPCESDSNCPAGDICAQYASWANKACVKKGSNTYCQADLGNCQKGDQCIDGHCVSGEPDYYSIQKTKCELDEPGLGTSQNKEGYACGGYCAAYFGIKCDDQTACKVNQDCKSGYCYFPDAEDAYGSCGPPPGSPEGGSGADHSEESKFWIDKKVGCFAPQQIQASLPLKADSSSCNTASQSHPLTSPSDLDTDSGEKLVNISCQLLPCTPDIAIPLPPKPKFQFTPIIPETKINIPTLKPFTKEDITFSEEDGKRYINIPFIGKYVAAVYTYLVSIVGIWVVVLIANAGLVWIQAGGNSEKITDAKDRIVHALTGLLLVLGSYTFLYLINPELVKFKALKILFIEREEFSLPTEADSSDDPYLGGKEKRFGPVSSGKGCSAEEIAKAATELAGQMICQGPCHCADIASRILRMAGCSIQGSGGAGALREQLKDKYGWIEHPVSEFRDDYTKTPVGVLTYGNHHAAISIGGGKLVESSTNIWKCWKNEAAVKECVPLLKKGNTEEAKKSFDECAIRNKECPSNVSASFETPYCNYCAKISGEGPETGRFAGANSSLGFKGGSPNCISNQCTYESGVGRLKSADLIVVPPTVSPVTPTP